MKKLTKIMALVLALALIITCFAGCGGKSGKKGGNSAKTIEISYWNSGLGDAWFKNMIKAFEAEYPEYDVELNASADMGAATANFGHDDDTTDIYFCTTPNDTSKVLNLKDLLNETADGDKKSLIDKIDPSILRLNTTQDGGIYSLPFGGGLIGIVYNKEQYKKAGITTTPRTTNELAAVCDTLKTKGYTPWIHYTGYGYWEYFAEILFTQMDGYEYYLNNHYACMNQQGTSPSADVFKAKDGRYDTLKALSKLITKNYVYAGSNSDDFTTAQTKFLQGEATMMVNGSWLANEMEAIGGIEKFETMRSPVISAIVSKLTTVKTDENLRKVITAIDNVTDGKKTEDSYKSGANYNVDGLTVSANDWKKIKEARYTTSQNFTALAAYIPTYSENVDGSKKFLSFMWSDKGIKVYTDALSIPIPVSLSTGEGVDTSELNPFLKSQFDRADEASCFVSLADGIAARHDIYKYTKYEVRRLYLGYNFVTAFCSANAADRKTADEIWNLMMTKVDENYDTTWLNTLKK